MPSKLHVPALVWYETVTPTEPVDGMLEVLIDTAVNNSSDVVTPAAESAAAVMSQGSKADAVAVDSNTVDKHCAVTSQSAQYTVQWELDVQPLPPVPEVKSWIGKVPQLYVNPVKFLAPGVVPEKLNFPSGPKFL
jgi:hypothetical protein